MRYFTLLNIFQKQFTTFVRMSAPVVYPAKPTNDAKEEAQYDVILAFMKGDTATKKFPPMESKDRKVLHKLAQGFKIIHNSMGEGDKKCVVIRKATAEEFELFQRLPKKPKNDAEAEHFYDELKKFLTCKDKVLIFPASCTGFQRKKIHEIADKFKFLHTSVGKGRKKHVVVKKCTPAELKASQIQHNKKTHAKKAPAVTIPPRPTGDAELEGFYDTILAFVKGTDQTFTFPKGLNGLQRKKIHAQSELFMLVHKSIGKHHGDKTIELIKVSVGEFKSIREQEQMLRDIVKDFGNRVAECQKESFGSGVRAPGIPVVLDRGQLRPHIRYVSWNIEWMDYFFQSDNTFHTANTKAGIDNVAELCTNIGNAILKINPDVITILEGPGSLAKMELFQKTYLNDEFECFGGIDGGSQRIFIMVRKGCAVKNPSIYEEANDYLSESWPFDVAGTLKLKDYGFIRRPVVVRAEVEINHEMFPIFFAGVHAKSKYINGGERLWKGSAEQKNEYIRKSIKNRRKIGAECGRLRKCLEQTAFAASDQPMVIVSGDMNDGPGMDFFEEYYLLFDSVDVLMGNSFHREAMLFPILNQPQFVAAQDQYSCVFNDYIDKVNNKKVMLDHIFVSDALRSVAIQAAFCHKVWEDNASSINGYVPRQEYLSDHRPVFADFSTSLLTSRLN